MKFASAMPMPKLRAKGGGSIRSCASAKLLRCGTILVAASKAPRLSPRARRLLASSAETKVQRRGKHDRASRRIDSKSFEIAQRAITQCRLMRSAKHDAGRLIGFESLLPTLRAEAPAIARFQPGEADFRYRIRQVIAARFGKPQESVGHDYADGVTANVLPASVATAVPVKAGHRIDGAKFKRLAKNIARRQPPAPLLFAGISQHRRLGKSGGGSSRNEFRRNAQIKSQAQYANDAQGATEVGPCLTDAAPKDRSQRTARIMTAMIPPERMRHQSSRLFWPGGSIRTSLTATVRDKSWPNFLVCQGSKQSPVPL